MKWFILVLGAALAGFELFRVEPFLPVFYAGLLVAFFAALSLWDARADR